ncbi:hypothetical protein [Clostridium lacusfryxellense]|uniref:hypothetical protein n=1 Tax=Clostridium lacusfryxellense TaxID=205328 RepID=UPI001C0C814E|nr:hypothetical protein [Clostridium lacusfryxellense]MBU3112679.1 hypothetical protein [Clostridium lacusfryxellense]
MLKHKDKTTVDPLNVDQWEFYIVPTEQLNEEMGAQKSIGINPLIKLNPIVTDYKGIKKAILECKIKI